MSLVRQLLPVLSYPFTANVTFNGFLECSDALDGFRFLLTTALQQFGDRPILSMALSHTHYESMQLEFGHGVGWPSEKDHITIAVSLQNIAHEDVISVAEILGRPWT